MVEKGRIGQILALFSKVKPMGSVYRFEVEDSERVMLVRTARFDWSNWQNGVVI